MFKKSGSILIVYSIIKLIVYFIKWTRLLGYVVPLLGKSLYVDINKVNEEEVITFDQFLT